jgi:hypothetical protein
MDAGELMLRLRGSDVKIPQPYAAGEPAGMLRLRSEDRCAPLTAALSMTIDIERLEGIFDFPAEWNLFLRGLFCFRGFLECRVGGEGCFISAWKRQADAKSKSSDFGSG